MASIYDLKPKFQQLLRPCVLFAHKCGATPNHVTLLALAGSFAVGFLTLKAADDPRWFFALPIWLFLRMALNAIDGILAREYDLKSLEGAILNELGDVISDVVLYLPLAFLRPDAALAIILFVLGSILTEFSGVLTQALGAKRHYEGPMGKSDRAFFVGLTALVSFIFPLVMDCWGWIFGAAFVLTLWTCINRLSHALKELKNG